MSATDVTVEHYGQRERARVIDTREYRTTPAGRVLVAVGRTPWLVDEDAISR